MKLLLTIRLQAIACVLQLAAASVPAGEAALAPPQPAVSAASAAPGVAGPRRVDTLDLDWTDAARRREVPVRLYWPADAAAAAPVPLVVVSHGIGGSRTGYRYLGQHLAAHGVASLHLQHVGSDRSLWGGGAFSLLSRLRTAASDDEAIERVRDLRFSLDELLDRSAWGPRIDRSRIAGLGHSYGANTMMLAVGARVPRAGGVVTLAEPRLKAAVLVSAPPIYGETDLAPILRAVDVPTLHITATDDVIRIPGYYSPASDRLSVYEAMGGPFKALAVFEGGSHNVFNDRRADGMSEAALQIRAATQSLALAFVQQVFQGRDDGLRQWPQAHKALLERFVRSPAVP